MSLIKKIFSWKEVSSCHNLMICLVLVVGVLNFFWGEKVPSGGGFGWDGVLYAKMVRNLGSMITGGQLSSYYTQRILPSSIVRCMLLFSGTSISDMNIIRGFELYNLILLLGACWAWKRVADNFSLSLSGRWIGFSGIFVNFECSKQAFYYPVLTDVTALFVAMLLLLFYVEKRQVALFVVTIIGAFAWPVVSVSGALLLMFLRTELPTKVISRASLTLPYRIKLGAMVILALPVIGWLILAQGGSVSEYAAKVLNSGFKILGIAMPHNTVLALKEFLTGIPSLVGMLVALVMLISSGSGFKTFIASFMRVQLHLLVLAIAAVLIPFCMVKFISNPDIANPSSLKLMIRYIFLPPEGKFLLPIVSLAVFWGPVVTLLVLYWKEFCVEARKLGPGVVAIIGISLPLGLVGEPRFVTIAWPFLVLGVVLALEGLAKKTSFKYVLAVLTVLYAQFWLKINLAPWPEPDTMGLLEFPKQIYFMHYGLWMSWISYLIQLPIVIFSTLWLSKTLIPK